MKNKKIFVYANEGCSRSKKMKPVFNSLQNNSNVNFEIFWMEKEWALIFSELEELENWPTIRFYSDDVMYWEIIGMATEEEILAKYNEV